MKKKEFNVKEWISDKEEKTEAIEKGIISLYPISNTNEAVEQLVQWVEATGTDLTSSYDDWLKIGFALANEFSESGASYFHRISKFYPNYTHQECEKQYQHCANAKGSGVKIATLFHYAKQAGYVIERKNTQVSNEALETNKIEIPKKELPEFSNAIFEELPSFFKESTERANNSRERDILLLGTITVLSACLPNVFGLYDDLTLYPNLYLFITAPPSSGKGRVNLCKRIIYPIHKQKREETSNGKIQYEVELAAYLSKKSKDKSLTKPIKPREQMLFIPANSSATGTFELLDQNDGSGLIFETEGDTLAQTFKTEYGNYSDGFRNAFHHEAISYYRRTDSELVEIPQPKISTVLTGTPDQVLSLMPDSQNGLFSRFMFYKMERQKKWRDVFANTHKMGLDVYYDQLGAIFTNYYQKLVTYHNGIQFRLSLEQGRQFHAFFSTQYDKFVFLKKDDLEASLLRLGVICFRLSMIFSIIRALENDMLEPIIECEQRDFEIALSMIKVLLEHTEEVFLYLPKKKLTLPKSKNDKELFLDALPREFTTKEYQHIGNRYGLSQSTSKRYTNEFIKKGWIHRKSHGQFTNKFKKGT
ncbi:DUF3987 domain-containing protein [uncultured Aquimarina sp.]|uniref:DUF3987 domain-containing protein n=1 Tax=uncultured Aquimarina sp. TaxID=575652 RepID=UPI00263463DA|nr:DUF3987 domain-containing protein [uncultured Aquimarina sp.]